MITCMRIRISLLKIVIWGGNRQTVKRLSFGEVIVKPSNEIRDRNIDDLPSKRTILSTVITFISLAIISVY